MDNCKADITFLGKYFPSLLNGQLPSEIPAENLPDVLGQTYKGTPVIFALSSEENLSEFKSVLHNVSALVKNRQMDEDKTQQFFNLRDSAKNTMLIKNAENGRETSVSIIMGTVYQLLKNKNISKKTFLQIVNAGNKNGTSAAGVACKQGNVGSLGNILSATADAYVNLLLNEDDYRTVYSRVDIDEAVTNRKRIIREKENFAVEALLPARQAVLKKTKEANNIISKRELLKKFISEKNL